MADLVDQTILKRFTLRILQQSCFFSQATKLFVGTTFCDSILFLDSGLLQPGADWSQCSLADFGNLMPCQMFCCPWGHSRDPEAEDSIFRDAWNWSWMCWYDVFVFWSSCLKILFLRIKQLVTTPKTNMTMENPPWMKRYFLLKMVIFQPVIF